MLHIFGYKYDEMAAPEEEELFRGRISKQGLLGQGFGETLCGPGQPQAFFAELVSHISFSVSTIPELCGEIVTQRGHSAHCYILILSKSVGLLHQLGQASVLQQHRQEKF
ncbi:uncharacterized [Tachysurus ichikawai]